MIKSTKSKFFQILLLSIFSISAIKAQDVKPDRWTPKDIIHTEYLGSASFSPENNMVVWTKRKAVKKKDKFVSDIYLTRLDIEKNGKFKTIQMTNKDESDHSPFFSRDGALLYFLSSRDKGKKLWSLNLLGGEPKEVKEFKNGISNIKWQNDSTFLFVSNDGKSLYDQELKEKKDNTVVVEDEAHWTIRKVYAFDLKQKTVKRITNNDYPVSSYAVSKDGKWLAYSTTQSLHYSTDANPKPKHYLKNLENGVVTEILQDVQQPGGFNFTADNEGFYFSNTLSSAPEWNGAGLGQLNYFNINTKTHQNIDLDWDWGMSGGYNVVQNDVIVSLGNGTTRRLAFYAKSNGWKRTSINFGDFSDHISINAISEDGKKVVYNHSTAMQLPNYYISDLTSGNKLVFTNEKELTKLNGKLRKKAITKAESIKWKGWNNEEVTGMLYYPENYNDTVQYPLMLSIHGGPTGADTDRWSERWSTYPNILAQRGSFVLKPNYHGSSNHGGEFIESIKENYYDIDLEDIIKGIDHLVAEGKVDTSKLGVMGWSNGAILATMLTVRYPNMFKVACPGAGDVNWTSDYGTCRFGVQFDQYYIGGAPWDDMDGKVYNEKYILESPLFELEKVKTPTIIFHGSEDRAVPRDQGWEYYRALQQAGKTEVRFLWFPGQPHGLQKITHQTRKMEEEIAWIDRHLFGKTETKNEALKKDSPLAMVLKKDKPAMHDGNYGVWRGNLLLPEVKEIAEDSIAIGIFEVTNAQFRMYNFKFKFNPSEVNHPAIVSKQEAERYIKWLSEKARQKYRLPNPEEAKSFQKQAKKVAAKENTLRHWAGYDLTPKDAAALQAEIGENGRMLLKPVGSFKPTKVGQAEVFDLGGNAAEYYGKGEKTYGYGAIDFVDDNGTEVETAKDFRGFRVVRE